MIKSFAQAAKVQKKINLLRNAQKPSLRLLSKHEMESSIKEKVDSVFVEKISKLENDTNEFCLGPSKDQIPKFFTHLGTIGKDLVSARIALGLSQAQLAKSLGWKRQQIQRCEKNYYASTSLHSVITVATHLVRAAEIIASESERTPQTDGEA